MKNTSSSKRLSVLILLGLVCIGCVLLMKSDPPASEQSQQPAVHAPNQQDVFTGMVVDAETRQPLEGVTVSYMKIVGMEKNQQYGETISDTITDSSGSFTLSGVIRPREHDPHITHVIHVKSPGYDSVVLSYLFQHDQRATVISLSKGFSIQGKVVSESGEPVKNALVGDLFLFHKHLEREKKTGYLPSLSSWAFTDQNGHFQLEGIRKGSDPLLRVVADGYIPTYSDPVEIPQSQDLTITLKKGGVALYGTVVNHEGNPMPNRVMDIWPTSSQIKYPFTRDYNSRGRLPFQTDAKGEFSIKNLPPRQYLSEINWFDKDKYHRYTNEEFLITIPNKQEFHHEFRFPAPIDISGKFIDGKTNEGIPGIKVKSYFSPETTTDTEGNFSISLSMSGLRDYSRLTYTLPEGYRTGRSNYGHYDLKPENKAVDYSNVLISLYPSVTPYRAIHAKVVDENGKTPNIERVFIKELNNKMSHPFYPPLDKQGKFTEKLIPGIPYLIWYEYDPRWIKENSPNYYAIHTFSSNEEENIIKFENVYSVKGKLVDQNGSPIPDVWLKIFPLYAEGSLHKTMWTNKHASIVAKTNKEGKFLFYHLFPGRATLTDHRPNNTSLDYKLKLNQPIEIKKGEITDLGEITCKSYKSINTTNTEKADAVDRRAIRFHISFPKMIPSPDYSIKCYDGETLLKTSKYYTTSIDVKGFNNLQKPIKVIISGRHLITKTLENVVIGDDKIINVEMESVPGYTVEVTNKASEQKVSRIIIGIIDTTSNFLFESHEINDYSSPYNIGPLDPGNYAIAVVGLTSDSQFDNRIGYTRFTVDNYQQTGVVQVDISNDYGIPISGTVSVINSQDIPKGSFIYLCDYPIKTPYDPQIESSPLDIRKTIIDKDGKFTFSRNIPGKYYLTFFNDEYLQHDEVEVIVNEEGPVKNITVPVYAAGKLSGTIKYPENRSPDYIKIKLQNEDPSLPEQWATIYDNGRYEFEKAYAGKATLTATAGIHPDLINDTVTIKPFETTEQDYDLTSNVLTSFYSRAINGTHRSFIISNDNPNNLHLVFPESYKKNQTSWLLAPGDYTLYYGPTEKWAIDSFTVPESQAVFKHEKNYNLCEVKIRTRSIQIRTKAEEAPIKLLYTCEKPDGTLKEDHITLSKESLNTYWLFEQGTYTFTCDYDEEYLIVSDPVEVAKGKSNITLRLKLKPKERR